MRDRHPTTDLFDALESRVLLSGDDHADYPDFYHATNLEFEVGVFIAPNDGLEYTSFSTPNRPLPGGEIDSLDDTDLFQFVAPGNPAWLSFIVVGQADWGTLLPEVSLYDPYGSLVARGLQDDHGAGLIWRSSFLGMHGDWDNWGEEEGILDYELEAGETYYISVGATRTGRYTLGVHLTIGGHPDGYVDDGEGGSGGDESGGGGSGGGDTTPDDEFPDRFETPTPLFPDALTADITVDGGIQTASDSDAFSIRSPAAGPIRIQLLSDDRAFAGDLMIFNHEGRPLALADWSLPGTKAVTQFMSTEGEEYTIVVGSRDGSLGDYTLQVDASPALYHYFYPAGYSSPTIDEFVPMVNPNAFEVSYAVYAHYETGESLQVLDMGTMPAHARAGITITSRRDPGASLTREAVPYALEIVASGPIGANLGHYDFGATTGEAFTDQLDTRWEFPEVVRQQGMRDLLVYYNPNKQPTDIRFTLLDERGIMHRFTRTLGAERRGGINFHNDAAIPGEGVYAVWIESDEPIVAAQTTFDAANGRGDGHLGQAGGGTLAGAFPDVSTEPGTDATIAVLNASGEEAVVRFSSPAIATPYILRIPARSRVSLDPADLGFAAGRSAPLLYTSTAPITARVMQYRHGDGDASLAATEAGTTFLNGAAWVDPRSQGTYIERLGLVNPARQATEVTVTFLFTDGTTDSDTFTLDAEGGLTIAIDRHEAIVRRGGPTAFSLRVDSQTPILASFVHYDLYLNGGWGTLAAPVGLTVPVAAITR